jgi:hypothetical protein
MIARELIRHSPLRILEKSTHGGLAVGTIGVIAGYKGVGKTACLVHIATDQLLQDKHVIHISFKSNADHVLLWYEDIFAELARRNNLDSVSAEHDRVAHNRIVMNFEQDGLHWPRIQKSLGTMITSCKLKVDTVVVDGYDFSKATAEEMARVREFALSNGLRFWFSCSLSRKPSLDKPLSLPGYLNKLMSHIAVAVVMVNCDTHVHLQLLKDHEFKVDDDMHLKLDPQSLLIAEK